MPPEAKAILEFSLMTASSVFFIVDPFATIPAVVVVTENDSAAKRVRMARQAAWTCFLVLTAFAFAGSIIFKMFSITLPAFKIAGGLLLFIVAMDMLQARRSQTQESAEERDAASSKEEVGIPDWHSHARRTWSDLNGNGSDGSIDALVAGDTGLFCNRRNSRCFVLHPCGCEPGSGTIILGEIGIRVLGRLMGLVLVAIAVQFVLTWISHQSSWRSRVVMVKGR